MSLRNRSLRIGCVQYLNAQPLIHGWPGAVDFDHPSALCRKLANAKLEVALVSSFEFLRNPIYAIADGVAVAADGPVYSVFLVLDGSIEEIEEVELDPASQTSVNLLRCLLAERGLRPNLVPPPPDAPAKISRTHAKVMIGDRAIRFRDQRAGEFEFWDLAEQWKKTTDLPFVFALWLIRPEVGRASEVADALRAQRDANVAALDNVIAAQKEFSREFCDFYFRKCLRFELGDAEKAGLLKFRSLGEKHGILRSHEAPLALV
ncbi:MAG: menaquinone biosynthesis protein [Verrucomicrobiota bacterium]|nr:menaquinone biosynthesis protein [Verrucomicrobiota bacterium]